MFPFTTVNSKKKIAGYLHRPSKKLTNIEKCGSGGEEEEQCYCWKKITYHIIIQYKTC